MHMNKRTATMIGLLGLVMLSGPGCSKSLQADVGAKTFEPGPSQAKQDGSGSSAGQMGQMGQLGQMEQAGQESPASQFGSLPGETGSASERTGSAADRTGKSGDEQVSESIAVAKAEPSDSVRQQEQMEQRQQEQAATTAAGLDDVYFAYDSWKLTEDGKRALSKDAEWLKTHGSQALAVEGHCDERGTQAYNLVLGQKRAKTVRNYLVELGIAGNRITVVSYGKDRPFCKESNESCYQQNRRGHLVVSSK